MKKTFISLALVLMSSVALLANNFSDILKNTVTEFDTTAGFEAKSAVLQKIERIALAEPDEWLAQYYAAYAYVFINYLAENKDMQDNLLDKGLEYLNKGIALNENESELYALLALWYSSKMGVAPAARGAKYAGKLNEALAIALAKNDKNPRTYFLKGQFAYHAPASFGGGKEAALTFFQTADELFKDSTNTNPLFANWGEYTNLEMLKTTKNELAGK